MTNGWEPGTEYAYGSVVIYEGAKYKIITPHRSQSDWAPPLTPALWGRIPNEGGEGHHQDGHHQHHQQEKPQFDQNNQQSHQGNNNSDQKPQQGQEEHHWYEDKKLLVGGGIAAGLLGAAGIAFAKKHHDNAEDQNGHTAWVNEARARTEQFNKNGPSGPATWLLTQGKSFPQYAIEVGQHGSSPVLISRVYYDGGKQIGAASGAFDKGAAVIGYKHKQLHEDIYEILVGDMRGLRWVPTRGKVNLGSLGLRPVEGGNENNGTPLYIAKAMYKGEYYPGKASATLDGAYIPANNTEQNVKEYEILCYA